ncbi:MAG: hypothetical protein ACAI43_11820 [Phycisphaerae bacterium]|nr:hypothetical protein [Tepidisphaeraceae bacterium]
MPRALLPALLLLLTTPSFAAERKTTVDVVGQAFHINGQPTYAGRSYNGKKVEGLLMNSRMVQGVFDDLNAETRTMWKYPDGGAFDADRNTREFVAAMPEWRKRGLLAFTINFQGGSPQGYSAKQPWVNSAFTETGVLRPEYAVRMERILDKADELGMAVILGYFYFGQGKVFPDDAAATAATRNATDWVIAKGYRNVIIEIANEANHAGYPEVIKPARAGELIKLVQEQSKGKVKNAAGRLYVSTSLTGGQVPGESIVKPSDYILLHGNGQTPEKVRSMVRRTRQVAGYRDQPIVFNEDDHFDFDKPENNMLAAVGEYASWGYFDFRKKGEKFEDGYQSVPVDWGITGARKRAFFDLLERVTGADGK